MNGKGSKPRPLSVPRSQFNDNWDRIFGKKKQETKRSPKKAEREPLSGASRTSP